ncbi:MAG: serine/threonine-protein kinase [bacterium]
MNSEVTTHEEIDQRLPNGTLVDARYRIEGHLGRGGFAHVYRARQIHLDRQVALKVLELPPGPSGAQFQARFIQEARIAARIKHRNVVDVFDFGVPTDLGQPYLAMEFLDGHDLEAELVRNGPMEAKRALKLFGDCLAALAEGHSQGIVHKDLKPTNLYLCNPRNTARELGRARLRHRANIRGWVSLADADRWFAGTPAYLAPEYIEHQTVSPALDVYQMGLIIIETLTASRRSPRPIRWPTSWRIAKGT